MSWYQSLHIYGNDCSITHDLHLTWGHLFSHGRRYPSVALARNILLLVCLLWLLCVFFCRVFSVHSKYFIMLRTYEYGPGPHWGTSLPCQEAIFLPPFVARQMIPRSRKFITYRLLLEYRSVLDRVTDKHTFISDILFGDARTRKWAKTGKALTGCSGTLSQLIGRGRISRVGSLVVRESGD